MSTNKPTFFVVPGGWHPPSVYGDFATHLENLGYPTITVSLPSFNASNPKTASCSEDTKGLRQKLLPLIEADEKEVVVIAHSYGGIPAGGAARGLSKTTRQQDGKKGGVLGMVYLAAFVVSEGTSLLEYVGGKHAPYLIADQPTEGLSIASPAIETFYNDINPETAKSLADSLLPQATLAYESPASAQAWAEPAFEGKLAFLKCTQDQALPLLLQDMFVERSGVKWTVGSIDAGHSAWASKPKEVAGLVEGFVGTFSG